MKYFTLLSVALILANVTGEAQSRQKRMVPAIFDSSSSVTIVTKVPFNGKYYFIKLIPVDSTNTDNMPMFIPNLKVPDSGMRVFLWRDSLQHLFPDSILRLLPGR